jgi:hypothetical protein
MIDKFINSKAFTYILITAFVALVCMELIRSRKDKNESNNLYE